MALAMKSKVVATPRATRPAARMPVVRASAVAGEVPDMNKRNIMNLILAGGVGLPALGMYVPYSSY